LFLSTKSGNRLEYIVKIKSQKLNKLDNLITEESLLDSYITKDPFVKSSVNCIPIPHINLNREEEDLFYLDDTTGTLENINKPDLASEVEAKTSVTVSSLINAKTKYNQIISEYTNNQPLLAQEY
jgi:hypothetical protein